MTIRVAVPVAGDEFCAHFGHCESFALFDADRATGTITGQRRATPPEHAPGVYPRWLAEQQATVVLAGGMGARARAMLAASGIEVVAGLAAGEPEALVASYLAGQLVVGDNPCDHGTHSCGDHHDES